MRVPDLHDDGWCLESGVERHLLHPESFPIPNEAARTSLAVGDFAKLIFLVATDDDDAPLVERMWVVVREVAGDTYFGLLDNEPEIDENDDFWLGAEVPFNQEHIIEIQKGDAGSRDYAARPPLRIWPRA
ncbi:MAG: hypothetical protein KF730_02765 [Sphingomonas sp.]|uniref:hypothetical protein n=1 Tax=Sphingomonas sp. TaxID=28214 RepID=UPI0025DCFAF5|nr:hypothetical protein [Sphingomonas sp.]MBX3563478.1 hypothetical protein [Sphingomonas sp.]